jgi:NitT/TauT family transport system substrate-binding protein
MIRRVLSILLLAAAVVPAAAWERVTVATMRLTDNGALFLAATRGYFRTEGIDLVMRAYPNPQAAVQALAALAGQGKIKAVAAQVREEHGHEGNEIVASDMAYRRGLRKLGNLVARSVAVTELGTNFHY